MNLAGLSTGLGVVSAALGVWITWQTHDLKVASEAQSLQIAEVDSRLRQRAAQREDTVAERNYTIAIYDKVREALGRTDPGSHQAALALVSTLPDPVLRERLSGAFERLGTASEPVRRQATEIRESASITIAQQQTLRSVDPRWAYDVFWCTANPQNQVLASRVFAVLEGVPNSRLRMRGGWTPEQNARPGYGVRGLEIRAEQAETEAALAIRGALEQTTGAVFTIKTVGNPTPNYISVFVCQ